MATSRLSEVVQQLRKAVLLREGAGLTDSQLLAQYISCGDQAPVATIVQRHGPMVWRVCCRVLGNYHDAEDAFQATFLVLVRRAASIATPELLANWLYGVARQTALKSRAMTAKRKARERQLAKMSDPAVTDNELRNDLQFLLDQELHRLPDKYRVAVVLCDLEGKRRKEAARQLGVPEGTLAARVARGRVMLAKRLGRHGLPVYAGSVAAVLTQHAASAPIPTAVVSSTIKAACLYAARQAAPTGVISVKVAALREGVLQAMLLSKLKRSACVTVVAVGLGLIGMNAISRPALAQKERVPLVSVGDTGVVTYKRPTQGGKAASSAHVEAARQLVERIRWSLSRIDPDKQTVSAVLLSTPPVHDLFDGPSEVIPSTRSQSALSDFPLAKNAKVLIDGKEAGIKDLRVGMRAYVHLARDKAAISRLEAMSITPGFVLKSADVKQNTITITTGAGMQLTLPLTSNTKIWLVVNREIQFTDLKVGMLIDVQLAVEENRIVAIGVRAYPPVKN